jgi:hypothetical protein
MDFFDFFHILPKISKDFRAAKSERFEILRDFIRFAVRAAESGRISRGSPLDNPPRMIVPAAFT